MFRWFTLVTFVGAIAVSGCCRHRARQRGSVISRRSEGGAFMAGRALVAAPLFTAVILYIAAPRLMAWASIRLPEWTRWSGVALGLAALPAVWWVLSSLGRNVSETVLTKTDHELVTWGPYHWVRHPLYTTGIGMFLAVGLMQASWFVLLLTALVAVLVRTVVIPAEERALTAKFGDRYRAYMRRTGRLLPRASSGVATDVL